MAINITTTPGIISPAYNPLYYNVYDINYNTDNFAWTSDVVILGSKINKPDIPTADFVTTNIGSFIKAPTNTEQQWWDPSRVAQTFLTYNFLPDATCVTPSGEECVAFLKQTLSWKTNAINKSVNSGSCSTYIFNGGDDRNDFRNFNTSSVGIYQVTKPFNYIPNYTYGDKSRFLTHFTDRTVDLDDTGTLSVLNGVFSAKTDGNIFRSTTASTDSFDFTTYKNGAIVDKWMLSNPYRNHKAFDSIEGQFTRMNRVTIPAYPKTLSTNAPWSFYDNYFTGGFGMISLTPHNFQVGDVIYVNQDPGYLHASYNGLHTILVIVSPYIIGTSTAWAGNSPTNGGSAVKNVNTECSLSIIDDTILAITGVTNAGGFAQFNFAVDVSNVRPSAAIFTSGSTYVTTNNTLSSGIIEKATSSLPKGIISNIVFAGNATGNMLIRERMPSATQELFTGVDKYKINLAFYSGSSLTFLPYGEGSTFNIDCGCSKHDRIELFWLNKMGAFDSMLFKGKNTKSIEFNKETYTKRLGDQAYSPFIYEVIDYKTRDFEATNFNGYQNTSFTVSTGWISETSGDRVIECMGSNVVYMFKDDVYTPVLATIESVDVKTKANQKLIYYTISLDLTYNRISQRN